tara:strand:- start:186 stop:1268 length:1083 start_codon:yes stop_codon:yes gene_type:complete
MKNPPRTTKIRGQKHLLAYITPDEAKLLKAMGGSGEKVNGVPAFYGFGSHDDASSQVDYGGGNDNDDRPSADAGNIGSGSDEDLDQDLQQDLAAAAAAAQGVDMSGFAFGDDFDPTSRQTARDVYSTMMDIRTATGLSPKAARDQILGYARNQLQNRQRQAQNLMRGYPVTLFGKTARIPNIAGLLAGGLGKFNLSNINRVLQDPNAIPAFDTTGKLQGAYGPGLFGFGQVYTGNRPNQPMFDDGKGVDTVPPAYNPVTGKDECPDGYMFDEDLQACRLAGGLPGGDGEVMTTSGPYDAGDYARMGLLDIAPMGMSLFADRYGVPQMDFDTSNLAFRRGAATRPQYFKQAPDLTGYTLLS